MVKVPKFVKLSKFENGPNLKTLKISKSTSEIKMSVMVKLPQSDPNLKMSLSGPKLTKFQQWDKLGINIQKLLDGRTSSPYIFFFMLLLIPFHVIG